MVVFIVPSALVLAFIFIFPFFVPRFMRRSILSMRLLSGRCWLVVGSPALGMLEGLPEVAPGVVPGATVWARAGTVTRARAAIKRVAFMEKSVRVAWLRTKLFYIRGKRLAVGPQLADQTGYQIL